MSGTLAIHVSGHCHYAAVGRTLHGPQALVDALSRRAARPNAVALGAREYWTGAAAMASADAGLAAATAVFGESDLTNAPLLSTPHWRLSGVACFALLVKRAQEEARACGAAVERVLVLFDNAGNASGLAALLAEYLDVSVEVASSAALMSGLASASKHAVKQRKLCVATVADAKIRVVQLAADGSPAGRVEELRGLEALRGELFTECDAAQLDGLSRERFWNEFLGWLSTAEATGPAAPGPFLPGLFDARLSQIAVTPAWALRRLGLLMQEVGTFIRTRIAGAELILFVDDELMPFWRRSLHIGGNDAGAGMTALPPDRLARHAAQRQGGPPLPAALVLGVRVHVAGESLPFERVPVLEGSLPRSGSISIAGGQPGATIFDIELAAILNGNFVAMRRLRFQAALPIMASPRFVVQLVQQGSTALRMCLADERSGSALRLIDSQVPSDGEHWLSGPETVSTLTPAGM